MAQTYGASLHGVRSLVCELTIGNGKVVYELNGITRNDWDKRPKNYLQTGDPGWDGIAPRKETAPVPPGRGSENMAETCGARLPGTRNWSASYELNGLTRTDWDKLPKNYLQTGDPRWDGIAPQRKTAPVSPGGGK